LEGVDFDREVTRPDDFARCFVSWQLQELMSIRAEWDERM
jgi:hypothetical protein